MISMGVSGLATDSPCIAAFGPVDEPLASCIIASVHGFMHETSDFVLYNNIFIYKVLCTLIYRRRSLYSFFLGIFFRKLADI